MDYTLIRSNRRTLAIQISDDARVVVRAPRRCSLREIETFLCRHTEWIETHLEQQRQRLSARPEPDEVEKAALIGKARERIPQRVAYFGALMGLQPQGITITGAKKRFGSCSGKNRLCFSWRLMRYPDEAVDYVVVHELAHLVHKNHGPDFYALVASALPDHKERRRLLRE